MLTVKEDEALKTKIDSLQFYASGDHSGTEHAHTMALYSLSGIIDILMTHITQLELAIDRVVTIVDDSRS